MNIIQLPLAACLISILLMVLFFCKENVKTQETKIYAKMLFINLFVSILCVVGIIFALNSVGNSFVGYLQKVYLSLLVFSIFLIVIYNLSIIEIKSKKLVPLLYAFNSIGIITILLSKIEVINDGIILDNYGPAYNIAMFLIILYLVIIILTTIIIILKTKTKTKKAIPFIILIVLLFLGLIIREYYPTLMFESFLLSFIYLIMYFTIENPDVKMINQLELAKQNAERANEAKTEFLSSMSHEIRTPLNAIVGFSNSIMEDNTIEEAKEEAKDIITASQNLLEIVNGILDISKIEAGKMEIIEVNYNLKDILNNVVKLIKPRIGEKPITLKVNISKDIPDILYGDMGKVREIVTNLLTNAVKYTEEGVIELSVQCINIKNKSKLVISVEDTGRGIKPDKIDKLFTKFQRLDEDRNTTLEGTGLGLAITKNLVEMLGGKIVVQSKYGSGSKFTVYLEQKLIKLIDTSTKKTEDQNTSIEDYSDKRILIVDDNNLNIKVAIRLLKSYKITPDTALSGEECLEKVKTNTYDLILMDDMMPKMSGTETYKTLKKDKNFTTPVVVLTANAISGMKEKYQAIGFDDYLAKPIDKLELNRILNKTLTKDKKK